MVYQSLLTLLMDEIIDLLETLELRVQLIV
jgi:hypothetical protein